MKYVKIVFRILIALVCAAGMAAILFVAYYYFWGREIAIVPGQTVNAHMHSDLISTVHYRDNFIFEPGPQPPDIQYLTYFTDFLEAKSSFRATFNRPVNVAYRFTATATLTIRRDGAGGGVVFQELFLLEEDFEDLENTLVAYNFNVRRDRQHVQALDWDWFMEEHPPDWDDCPEEAHNMGLDLVITDGDLPGGIVRIHLEEFLEIVDDLVTELAFGTGQLINTSADLEVNFTHRIFVRDYSIDESISRSLIVPLRRDSFTFNTTGTPSRTATGRLDTRVMFEHILDDDATPDVIIDFMEGIIENENVSEEFVIYFGLLLLPLFAIGLYLSVGGGRLIVAAGRKLRQAGTRITNRISKLIKGVAGSHDRKVNKLLKKYTNEIVMVSSSMRREYMEVNAISDFKELLKLSLFTNHPVFCFNNEKSPKFAEFSVVFEGCVYCYMIVEEAESPPPPPTEPASTEPAPAV